VPGLLHLDASARSTSFSRRLGARYADGWRATHPGAGYVHRDLAADPVPFIGEAWTELCDEVMRRRITDPRRYPEVVETPAQRAAWAVVAPLLDELVTADVVLVATPMYNYSVPAALKAWIDQVTFPRMSLAGTRFVVVCARGGTYLPGTPRAAVEHATTYLRDFLDGHFAVTDVDVVAAELVNARVDPALAGRRSEHEASVTTAEAEIDRLVAASAATAA
jgi:FMN-dependent NADH-azoreductase